MAKAEAKAERVKAEEEAAEQGWGVRRRTTSLICVASGSRDLARQIMR